MHRFRCYLALVIISLTKACYAENSNIGLHYYTGDVRGVDQHQEFSQPDHLIITSPDYLNPNSQISFAAPVGAQHPNQKPQPEPQPPKFRHYQNNAAYIDSGFSRSYVHYQRTIN